MSSHLQVLLSGQRVGLLERDRRGRTIWTPDADWIAAGQFPRLSLSMLRNPGRSVAGTGVPIWFENLLPEETSVLRVRLAKYYGLRDSDSLRLLSALGSDLPGAVELIEDTAVSSESSEEETPTLSSASRSEHGAERLRFSLAGMQMKLSMAALGSRLTLTASARDRQWIVKLPGRSYPELPHIEAATMAWAQACGQEVPVNKVVSVEDLEGLPPGWAENSATAYAIERFDRRPDGTRIHHEDFCQALDILPVHKYGGSGPTRVGHDGILRMVADVAGQEEARKLARRVGFVIASGNDDAHLKNWSLEWGSADAPRLSPSYDQVSTISWRGAHGWGGQEEPKLSLSIGRVKKFRLVDAQALERHARRSGQRWAKEAVLEGIERARDTWPQVKEQAPEVMRQAIAEHWRRVPVLRSVGELKP